MINTFVLIAIGFVLIYDLYRYFMGKDTITQIVHANIGVYELSKGIRLALTIGLWIFSWRYGSTVATNILLGWMLCHLICWDF